MSKINGAAVASSRNNNFGLKTQIKALMEALTKETKENSEGPSVEQCTDILASIQALSKEHTISIQLLEETMLGKLLTKSLKVFRRCKRSASSSPSPSPSPLPASDSNDSATGSKNESENQFQQWENCIKVTDQILISLKEQVAAEVGLKKAQKIAMTKAESQQVGLPKTISAYRERLRVQKKEMYKDPPAMPPPTIRIDNEESDSNNSTSGGSGRKMKKGSGRMTYALGIPTRDEKTGEYTFQPGDGASSSLIEKLKDFRPNRSPEEVMRSGSFGGTYFRPIVSAVTNMKYKSSDVLNDSVQKEWIDGLNARTMLTSQTYNAGINKYKVKCGGSLGMWESSGWISDADPYGWFQWYCRFYQGRRCSDDERQVSRWLKSAGPKGRFRSQLCNKIFAAGGFAHVEDVRISPVIRQTLLHWGLEITNSILHRHGKRVGKI